MGVDNELNGGIEEKEDWSLWGGIGYSTSRYDRMSYVPRWKRIGTRVMEKVVDNCQDCSAYVSAHRSANPR